MENLAVKLIPYRKWMLVTFLVAFVGVVPAAVGLMVLFKQPWLFKLGMFLATLGVVWSWGLFLISYWYNPDGGSLTLDKIRARHPLIRWNGYLMRYYAPACLAIWFLSPFAILALLYPLLIVMI